MNITDLRTPEKNVRKHNENQIREFCRSLEKFGQIRPVVVDENNVVYCGNGLVAAAKSLGWEKIDVLRKTGMSEADKKKLMIADNRIYSLGYEDFDAINEMLEEIGDFDIPGFDTESLEAMFGDVEEDILSFGILDDEEKEEVKAAPKYEQTNQFAQASGMVEQDGAAERFPGVGKSYGNSVAEENTATIEESSVVCPNCGHVFK